MRRLIAFMNRDDVHAVFSVIGVLVMFGAGALAVTASRDARDAVEQIRKEGRERRGQYCLPSERGHLEATQDLQRRYDYLLSLTPAEKRMTLNEFVLRDIPRVEAEARADQAPDFCDEPGLGLPEPDPVIPKRPAAIDRALRELR
jgi:hypothetical protein